MPSTQRVQAFKGKTLHSKSLCACRQPALERRLPSRARWEATAWRRQKVVMFWRRTVMALETTMTMWKLSEAQLRRPQEDGQTSGGRTVTWHINSARLASSEEHAFVQQRQ